MLRTAHIAVMALWVGGRCFSADPAALRPWHLATVATGLVLLVSEASHSRHWVYQGRGVIGLTHVALAALVAVAARAAPLVLVAAVVVGSVGSHLPRSIRKWSLRHRRIVDD